MDLRNRPEKEKRKQMIADYQERERKMGIYSITNKQNGRIFINASSNMDGLWGKEQFVLDTGTHHNKELQKEWKQFGRDSFTFEVLEQLELEHKVKYDYHDVFHNETQRPADVVRSYNKELDKLKDEWLLKLQPYGDKGYHTRKDND